MGPEVKAWIRFIKSVTFASFLGGPCKNSRHCKQGCIYTWEVLS